LVFDDEWTVAEPEDEDRIRSLMKDSFIELGQFYPTIGFMHPFKRKEMVFKVKNMTLHKNNKGARIDQAAKPEIVSKINAVVGKEMYTIDTNLRMYGLAIILEMVMRYKTEKREANMFFSPEKTLLNGVVDA
jgi:hypothetical protein